MSFLSRLWQKMVSEGHIVLIVLVYTSVPNCPPLHCVSKLSSFTLVHYGAKLSWCQIVLFYTTVPNCSPISLAGVGWLFNSFRFLHTKSFPIPLSIYIFCIQIGISELGLFPSPFMALLVIGQTIMNDVWRVSFQMKSLNF